MGAPIKPGELATECYTGPQRYGALLDLYAAHAGQRTADAYHEDEIREFYNLFSGDPAEMNPHNFAEYWSESIGCLTEALAEFCADYCYLDWDPGTLVCKIDRDAMEHDHHDGLLIPISDTSEIVPIGTAPDGSATGTQGGLPVLYLHTNDHGNQTLYDSKSNELWAVV